RERQALPHRDECAIPRVRRIDARKCLPITKIILMSYWPRLKAPIFLEVIGACADLAPAEIKKLVSLLNRPTHHLPIHQIVCPEVTGLWSAARIVGHHPVAKIEAQEAADRPSLEMYG